MGSPEIKEFSIEALNEGKCEFRIAYARPWEFEFNGENGKKEMRLIEIPLMVSSGNE